MNSDKLKELKQLIDSVMNAHSKKEAQDPVKRLDFMLSVLNGEINANQYNKLTEVVNLAKTASGQVKDKEHWISNVNSSWYVFQNLIKNE